ncbi:nardilysin b [Pimephales promelas]|uniref:nardilysin b n=1 Tax=Pimephales promelas TaxID=90988 RepID=UPI001955871B|nr:nardilysin b [Pimephales promelas]KAG1945781.1 insulin-degrading enzyme [Pimephales promelas]
MHRTCSGPVCEVTGPESGEPPPVSWPESGRSDPRIIKSPNDPKKYRYIELSNGLKVLLISDLAQSESGKEPADEEEEENVDSESADENRNDMNKCSEERKKACRSEKQSAAALCISVGSFSDPADLPGLAHFLEHMVFMGSEKYPDENGFDAFLKKHGGSDNASTDCERTIFQFDVQRKYFKEALDRWAQFFICPLMIPDAVDREVEAVDSEYQMGRPLDSNRKEMLFGSLAKANHPMSKFFWGNAQTLKDEPREKNINTYERLREFWRRFYSAHYMTLTVQSRDKLDTLEEWVREIFIKIPNNGLPRVNFSDLQDPFDTPDFNKLYRVVPVRKVHALTISWALPPQGKHYRVKPLHYISWLIGHEGAGSVLSLLRKKCWALGLFGGNSETGFDQNTTYSIFSVSVTLSDEGFQNFFQVIHTIFQYLKMLQSIGPQQRIYEEIQKIEANEFHYQEQTEPIEFVANICENMQLFPKEDFLCGDQLLFEYNPEVISAALTLLTPVTANILLLSPKHDGLCPLKEKWFGTQYSVEDIPQEYRDLWARDFPLNPDLHLPAENKFIASDFTLKTSDCPDTDFPVKIIDNERGCLWFRKDSKFKIPKAYARFQLLTPIILESPKNLVLLDLFVNILAHNLAEPAYDAVVAQLEYTLIPGDHGLFLRLKGFNHKLPLLLNLIVDHLADFSTTPDVFSMFTEQLKKTYYTILIKPDQLGRDVRLQILEHHRFSVMQKYEAIMADISVADLMDFVNRFRDVLYIEGLIQGNFTSTESKEFLQYFIDKLQYKAPPAALPVMFRVVELPQTHHLCKVQSLNLADANSEVTVYYQAGLKNLREHTLMELLVMHMEEPCFDFLRTKETLGYQVYPACRNTSCVLGFSVTVETQATKFSTDFVEDKIEAFLVSFGEKMNNLSDEAFQTQVSALIKLKECEDTHLGDEVDRNWFEVVTQQYVFERLNKEIEVLKDVTKDELVSFFMEHRHANSRKLSIHVVGFGEREKETHGDDQSCSAPETQDAEIKISSYGNVSKLIFLPASPVLAKATMITDICVFTSSLNLHPYHKILM